MPTTACTEQSEVMNEKGAQAASLHWRAGLLALHLRRRLHRLSPTTMNAKGAQAASLHWRAGLLALHLRRRLHRLSPTTMNENRTPIYNILSASSA